MVIAPPAIYLLALQEILRKDVKVSAQNCYFKPSGAFTGEIRCVCGSRGSGGEAARISLRFWIAARRRVVRVRRTEYFAWSGGWMVVMDLRGIPASPRHDRRGSRRTTAVPNVSS